MQPSGNPLSESLTVAPAVAGSGGASGRRRLDKASDWVSASPFQDSSLKEREFSSQTFNGGFNSASGAEKIGSSSGGSGGWDRPLAYGYEQAFEGGELGIMGITGTAVGVGVVGAAAANQAALVAGNFSGQRLIVGPLLGGTGSLNRSVDKEPIYREHAAGLYGHQLAIRRGEEESEAGSSAPNSRPNPRIVAFVGGEVRLLHALIRNEEVPKNALRAAGDHEQGEAVEAETWSSAVGILSRAKSHHEECLREDHAKTAAPNNMDAESMEQPNPGAEAASTGEALDRQNLQLQQNVVDNNTLRPRVLQGIGTAACRDCGNQAKKDCPHMRCRTCCKSRGFDCATHVKSTWVPASKRRERHQAEIAAAEAGQPWPKSKRSRSLAFTSSADPPGNAAAAATSHTSTSTGTPPPSSDFNSPHLLQQEAKFKGMLPPEVRTQAVFKCVRVTGVEDGQHEYAYQAAVKIGGHIFKGLLYDQGVDKGDAPSIAELQLGGRTIPPGAALIDLAGIYGSAASTFLGALR